MGEPVRELPIIFSGPMVRAILAGKKTQTRRRVAPGSFAGKWLANCETLGPRGDCAFDTGIKGAREYVADPGNSPPYGAPGDRLWVRENWAEVPRAVPHTGEDEPWRADGKILVYQADPEWEGARLFACSDGVLRWAKPDRWRPSIHMPRWACRLVLEVTAVRVERLQDISEQDAQAEGIPVDIADQALCAPNYLQPGTWFQDWTDEEEHYAPSDEIARASFRSLWESINGKRAPWASNPWVWVVSFKRIESAERLAANG